ncbi:hypothetical protein Aph02nite_27240 [Actinoplanes philippinensis]|nr:hypothetical protein Aph02nite_27240 [Actinoplanes philippinensis]
MPLLPPPMPESHRAELSAFADEVRAELAAAGLPIHPGHEDQRGDEVSGVLVELADDFEPGQGGVWVSWWINSPLAEAALRARRVGAWRRDGAGGTEWHPALRHLFVVRAAMSSALEEILQSLGYAVLRDVDDYREEGLLVRTRAPGPHWRDRAVPPLAGSTGYTPGIRVRLVAGDFAGAVTTVISHKHPLGKIIGPPLEYTVEHPDGEGQLTVAPEDLTLAEDEEIQP